MKKLKNFVKNTFAQVRMVWELFKFRRQVRNSMRDYVAANAAYKSYL